ncbi:MAG: hypothetical protein ACKOQ8_05935 [Micrococcales bacterium]
MTATLEVFELSSNCTCEYIDDETGEFVPGDCYGDCWTDARDYAIEAMDNWATDIGFNRIDDARLAIHASNMGWTRSASTALADSIEEILNLLALPRAEYRLVFKREDNDLTVMRYSHDEPTGASFRIVMAL